MKKNNHLNDTNLVEDFETQILSSKVEALENKIKLLDFKIKIRQESEEKLCSIISKHVDRTIEPNNMHEVDLSEETWHEIFDEALDRQNKLIKSRHHYALPYSLIRKQPDLQNCIPKNPSSTLELLTTRSASRASEIIQEYSSENTNRAYMGDIVYWQAWLGAIGFSFETPITENEVTIFVIQHAEGLDSNIDKRLVEEGYKYKLGPHKLATIKRRIASLSVFLDSSKWSNPCRNQEIRHVLGKLTKKYGSSKPAGKAITKDILDDMLDTCKDKLIDIRDRAVLLFAWGTGGRRRAEVVSADMKDLTKSADGDFVYIIPQSKTDQEGKGSPVPVYGRVAYALSTWLEVANIKDGAIFRAISKGGTIGGALSDDDIYRIVKKRLKMAGYDEKQFGAHSLRSGFVTEAGRRGKPIGDVMQMTTHRNVGTVMKYYQTGNIKNNSAANLAD